jgi:hypothetical protein
MPEMVVGPTVMTLARYYALRDVKARMPRLLLREMGASGLRRMAGDYLQENPGAH